MDQLPINFWLTEAFRFLVRSRHGTVSRTDGSSNS